MDGQTNEKQLARQMKEGYVHLTLFVMLIFAGIYVKRVMGHPEFMMLFHGPAAVFLVIGGLKVSQKHRQRFKNIVIKD